MSVQMNTQVKNAAPETNNLPKEFTRANAKQNEKVTLNSASTVQSMRQDDETVPAPAQKKCCSCCSKIYHKMSDLVNSMFKYIKFFFCGKETNANPNVPKTALEEMQELSTMLETADKDAITAQIAKMPEAKRNEMFHEVYLAKSPQSPVTDSYGEEEVNNNPKDPITMKAMQGYIARQEKIMPLEDLLPLVDDNNVTPGVFAEKLATLPTDARGKNLLESLALAVAALKKEKADEQQNVLFGLDFLKKNPHDPAVKSALEDTIALMKS